MMNLKSVLGKISKTLKGEKELTPKESQEMMKNLINTSAQSISEKLRPGALLTFQYNAKDKTQIYDKTPFVMVLNVRSKYVLAINFHWMPVQKRLLLVKYILSQNQKNIRNKKPLLMTYPALRRALKTIGGYPVIRLYIKRRMSAKGVVVPDEMILQAAKMKTETFTGGKVNSTTLWSRAKSKALSAKRRLMK